MRTDSLRVSDEATQGVRDLILAQHGERYLPAKPPRYQAGKLAQEAHEAIRPTDLALSPEAIKGRLTVDQLKLYRLIYRRFVASQMTPAVFAVTDVEVTAGAGLFKAQGKI
jgi:DNA topoisomerase-1